MAFIFYRCDQKREMSLRYFRCVNSELFLRPYQKNTYSSLVYSAGLTASVHFRVIQSYMLPSLPWKSATTCLNDGDRVRQEILV